MNWKFWQKQPRHRAVTARALLVELKEIHDRVESVLKYDLSAEPIGRNGLVDPIVLDNKLNELRDALGRTVHSLENAQEFTRCLHNWLSTPPPGPKVPAPVNEEVQLSNNDLEFLEKLEEAKRWSQTTKSQQ